MFTENNMEENKINILFLYHENNNNINSSFGTIIKIEENIFNGFLINIQKNSQKKERKYEIKNFIANEILNENPLITTNASNFSFNHSDDEELNKILINNNIELNIIYKNDDILIYSKDYEVKLEDYFKKIKLKDLKNEYNLTRDDEFTRNDDERKYNNFYTSDENIRRSERWGTRTTDDTQYDTTRNIDKNEQENRQTFNEFSEHKTNEINRVEEQIQENRFKQQENISNRDIKNSGEISGGIGQFQNKNGFTQFETIEFQRDRESKATRNTSQRSFGQNGDRFIFDEFSRTEYKDGINRNQSIITRIDDILYSDITKSYIRKFSNRIFDSFRKYIDKIDDENFEKRNDNDRKENGIFARVFNNSTIQLREQHNNGINRKRGDDFRDFKEQSGENRRTLHELETRTELSSNQFNREENLYLQRGIVGVNERIQEQEHVNFKRRSEENITNDRSIKDDISKELSNDENINNFNSSQSEVELLGQNSENTSNNLHSENFKFTSKEKPREQQFDFGASDEIVIDNNNGISNSINAEENKSLEINREHNNTDEQSEINTSNKFKEYDNTTDQGESQSVSRTSEFKFKSFKTHQFLKRFDKENYKGEYPVNLSVKERIEANIEAIKLTQKIFNENRLFANEEEKKILARYTAFGGLRDLFYNEKYEEYKLELKELIDDDLYKDLKDSSYNAYFTPDFIIKNIYKGLDSLGVSKNNKIKALEPSCGIGKFFSYAPQNYEFDAVEKDLISATIAKFLHPNVRIYNNSFEKVDFNKKEYDVVVGNPPYEQLKIKDMGSLGNNLSIHNYFAVKSSELLKDNGILSFIISSYFLDSNGNKHRKILNDLGNFISAFRMPNDVFKNSHADTLTDIFFYQRIFNKKNNKKSFERETESNNIFMDVNLFKLSNEDHVEINNYFIQNPEQIIGNPTLGSNQFGRFTMEVKAPDYNYNDEIINRMERIHSFIFKDNPPFEKKYTFIDYDSLSLKEFQNIKKLNIGSMFLMNDKIYIKKDIDSCEEAYFEDELPLEKKYLINEENIIRENKSKFVYKSYLNDEEKKIASEIIKYRDLIKENLANERNHLIDNEVLKREKENLRFIRRNILNLSDSKFLNSLGNSKKDKNGLILKHRLKDIIELDKINSFSIFSTEKKVTLNDKNTYLEADFLKERIYIPYERKLAQSNEEALQKTLTEKGYIDLNTLKNYSKDKDLEKILVDLLEKRLIFHVLNSDRDKHKSDYILADEFLTGNVKAKYNEIKEMIEKNISFNNFSLPLEEVALELKKYFPEYIKFEDIELNFGASYIDIEIYKDFIKNTFFHSPDKIIIDINFVNSLYVFENFKILKENYDEYRDENILVEEEIKNTDLNDNGINLMVYNEKSELFFDLKTLIEKIINGKSLEVFHYEQRDDNPQLKVKVNENIPTKIALENAEAVKDYFESYCFNNKNVREKIEKKYNEVLNVYNKTNFSFSKYLETPYLNKNITLREHQKNAVFKGILKNSMLLEHEVGAGKTLAGITLIMEQVRMGIVKKALFLVPNHLATQWEKEFLFAYPNANILVGDKIKDKKDRKEFLYKIKYGNYDAIIMKHSTFENISVMESFQTNILYEYAENLKNYLTKTIKVSSEKDLKNLRKTIDKKIKYLEAKLEKRAIGKKYDEEIAFEELGIDALVVDEAHNFKNLYIDTNQDNVKGLPLNDSFKAMKMLCATSYCHQNNYKLYFLTGTPISNSIAEFYIMQKFLQPKILEELGVSHFDDWQKTFTKITFNEELDSSGVNYKLTSRLSQFINVPELMSAYRENVDIVTNEDIEKQTGRLVPKIKNGRPINVISPRSYDIESYIGIENEKGFYNKGSIIDRMDNLRENPRNNNMLKCTSDAKKAALDFRLIDNSASDYEDSKINKLIDKVMFHYNDQTYPSSTQLIFCDMGVSKIHSQKININAENEARYNNIEEAIADLKLVLLTDEETEEEFYAKVEINEKGKEKIIKRYTIEELMEEVGDKFDLYAEILKKLVKSGISQNEIAFIGDANSDIQKQELFNKVNAGEIRILIGSTAKMGAGTNVQKRVIALHELDCPWKPSDLQQRAGRVVRQGNLFFEKDKDNFEISHYRYATEQTYDSRMFQINEQKLLPLAQLKKINLLDGKRNFESIDAEIANVSEMKAIATGNPFILEKHKISTMLKTEERYFEQHKKNILQNERLLTSLKEKKELLLNDIEFLNEFIHNKDFKKENYNLECFGIKTTKKPKNKEDEESHKSLKNKINEKIKDIFINFKNEAEVEILKANDLKLVFRTFIGELTKQFCVQGVLINKYDKEYIPNNLFFKADNGSIFYSYPEIDNILIKITNTIEKSNTFLNNLNERLKNTDEEIFLKEKFLSENKLDTYDRKILLDTLKKDLRNINEIFTIRNKLRKNGIKINMNSPEIKNLLPDYSKLLNEKGKFVASNLRKDDIEKKIEIKNEEKNNIIEIETEEIKINEIDDNSTDEEKIDILINNQKNINNFIRAKDILQSKV